MVLFAALPLSVSLAAVALSGMVLGALVNWAIYRLAWHPREISPWGPAPAKAPPRKPSDRIPVLGWLGLRREHTIHGRGFWIRPLLIELFLGVGLAVLYWWEVDQLSLILPQMGAFFLGALPPAPNLVSGWFTHSIFFSHVILILLMASASFIDIDEKIIPDEITVPGTLLGLLLATLLPLSFLPHGDVHTVPPVVGETIALPPAIAAILQPGEQMVAEPTMLSAPNPWPDQLKGAPRWGSLALGQACWWLWCFALTPRIWRSRHGPQRALQLIVRRVVRELTRPPLGVLAWVGSATIAGVWWWASVAWMGLLTSLVGMAVSGGLIWIVRIVGTAALQREAMGFGDVTLMTMIGAFLGWQAGVIIFFVSPFAGLVVGIVQAIARRDDVIPYGPFLCLGTLFVMVQWPAVWNPAMKDLFQVGWLVPVVLVVCFGLLAVMLVIWQQVKKRLF
ncbi:MAG: A24 family peptidase [Pirellulales bacterium]|nr:A24 family peptidase [Pirellulales bacterium]